MGNRRMQAGWDGKGRGAGEEASEREYIDVEYTTAGFERPGGNRGNVWNALGGGRNKERTRISEVRRQGREPLVK